MSDGSQEVVESYIESMWADRLRFGPKTPVSWLLGVKKGAPVRYRVYVLWGGGGEPSIEAAISTVETAEAVLYALRAREGGLHSPREEQKIHTDERLRIAAQEIFRDRSKMFRNSKLEWDGSWDRVVASMDGVVVWERTMRGYPLSDIITVVRHLREMEDLRAEEQAKINEPPPVMPFEEFAKHLKVVDKETGEPAPKSSREALAKVLKNAYGGAIDDLFRREYPATPEGAFLPVRTDLAKHHLSESAEESRLIFGPDIFGQEDADGMVPVTRTFKRVRREQIRETGGDRSFGPVLSKEPCGKLYADYRVEPVDALKAAFPKFPQGLEEPEVGGPSASLLVEEVIREPDAIESLSECRRDRVEGDTLVSLIPGARDDWAPTQVVTYEQDLGEDLELSDAELRAWAKR